jgi:hypothetical protein
MILLQHNQRRLFMMDHTSGWMGGQTAIWVVLAVLVVVVVVIKSLFRKNS